MVDSGTEWREECRREPVTSAAGDNGRRSLFPCALEINEEAIISSGAGGGDARGRGGFVRRQADDRDGGEVGKDK